MEIYLGNWGTIVCDTVEFREYIIAAYDYSEIRKNAASWHGAWLYPKMEGEYLEAEKQAKIKCEILWEKLPDKENTWKKH